MAIPTGIRAGPTGGEKIRLSGWTTYVAPITIGSAAKGRQRMNTKTNRGFTLIELMVVVAIIAILAAIAIPAYFNQIRKGRRSDVEQAMQQIALMEERYRADCWGYSNTFGTSTCPAAGSATIGAMGPNPYNPSTAYYNVGFKNYSLAQYTNTYTIQATANTAGGQNKDRAGGTSCSTLEYHYGTDCSDTAAAGQTFKCPAECWAQ